MEHDSALNDLHALEVRLGQRIRSQRQRAGMSLHDLATAIGATPDQVAKYERGENSISAARLFLTAHALGVSVETFFAVAPAADVSAPEAVGGGGGEAG